MINEFRKIDLEELKERFSYILDIVRGELFDSNTDADLYVLSLIFYKRLNDISPEFIHIDKSFSWKMIRNIATHSHTSYGLSEVAELLENAFYELEKNNHILKNIFGELSFKKCEFISSIFAIIAYLDSIPMALENISLRTMGQAFDNLIQIMSANRYENNYILPNEIINLITEIVNPKPTETLYDPAAGSGAFLTHAARYVTENYGEDLLRINGQEINKKLYSISKMNLIMNGIYNPEIYLGDTILNPGNSYENKLTKFNKIITKIPFSVRKDSHYEQFFCDKYHRFFYGIPPRSSSDFGYIQHIIASMSDDGQAAIIIPDKILSSEGNEKEIRKHIIEDDLIESVISLPDKYMQSSKIPSSILVLNKSKPFERKEKILFIKVMQPFKIAKHSKSNIDFNEVVNIFKRYKEIEGISRIIDVSEVFQNNFNLNYKRYDNIFIESQELLNNGSGKRLKDIVNYISEVPIRYTIESENGIPYIRMRDLNDSIREKNLDVNEIEKRNLIYSKEVLKEKAIIISLFGDKLKPTIFDPYKSNASQIIIGQNTFAIVPKSNLIDLEYLYYQLYSPRVLKQIEYLRMSVVPRIRKNDFLNIVIAVPELKVQEEYIKEQKLSLMEIEILKDIEKERESEFDIIAQNAQRQITGPLSHNALPYIFYIKSNLELLEKFLNRNNLTERFISEVEQSYEFDDIEMLMECTTFNKETVKDVINRIYIYLKTLEEYIDKTNKIVKLELDKKDFKLVELSSFFNDFISLKKAEIQNKYELVLEMSREIYLEIHESSFNEIFGQLLRNAEMHAFDFSNKRAKYIVKIKVTDSDDFVFITYTNNGKPFELSKEHYISPLKKGRESKGQGLGGAYINKVINAHGGKLEIFKRDKGMEMQIIISKKGGNHEDEK